MSTHSDGLNKLLDQRYRSAFVASQINIQIPFQIRALRKQRGWTQPDLAEKADMKQPRISAMEKPGGANFNLDTLKRLAEAFDIALIVRFAPFSELLEWSDKFAPDDFKIPSFAEELPELERQVAVDRKHREEQEKERRRIAVLAAVGRAHADLFPDLIYPDFYPDLIAGSGKEFEPGPWNSLSGILGEYSGCPAVYPQMSGGASNSVGGCLKQTPEAPAVQPVPDEAASGVVFIDQYQFTSPNPPRNKQAKSAMSTKPKAVRVA